MLDLGKHAVFIWSSYAIVGAVMLGLIAWLLMDGRRLKREQDELDRLGVRRRSEES
ncbi:MAG: heme exporter protein CcmD [Pseudomonadota bacterium]